MDADPPDHRTRVLPDVELPSLGSNDAPDRLAVGVAPGRAVDAWSRCVDYVHRYVGASVPDAEVVDDDPIKPFDPGRGTDAAQLSRVLGALDRGQPVAFCGWWPRPAIATVTTTLGVDVLDVPTPDRKGEALADGHSVVLVGYARHHAFAGGGYFVVRDSTPPDSGAEPVRYLPFTYVRAYATALLTAQVATVADKVCPVDDALTVVGDDDQPAPGPLDPDADGLIARHARCADPRATYTSLFFSESAVDTLRAKAICTVCAVKELCLARALERREPYGVWGGEFLFEGAIVAVKRGRGRPSQTPMPDRVDEITGEPLRVA